MKTKTSLFTIIGVVSLVSTTAAFGAATVRTLGGAGTYSGVSSAAAAKSSGTTSTSGTSTTRSRAGTLRVTPSVGTLSSGTKTTTTTAVAPTSGGTTGTVSASGNDGSNSRMSIGKYLNGSSLTTFGKTTASSTVSDATIEQLTTDVSNLQNQISVHDTNITELENRANGYDTAITNLEDTVGGTSQTGVKTGLVKDVADLQDEIGDEETGGLLKRVKDLETAEGPDLTSYATQSWVNNQGFLKEHQSLDNYATKDMVPNVPSAPSGEGSGGAMYVLNKTTDAANPTWEKVAVKQTWGE